MRQLFCRWHTTQTTWQKSWKPGVEEFHYTSGLFSMHFRFEHWLYQRRSFVANTKWMNTLLYFILKHTRWNKENRLSNSSQSLAWVIWDKLKVRHPLLCHQHLITRARGCGIDRISTHTLHWQTVYSAPDAGKRKFDICSKVSGINSDGLDNTILRRLN